MRPHAGARIVANESGAGVARTSARPARRGAHAAAGFLVAFAAILALPPQAQAQTAGICGRTAAVRTAILLEIPGVSNCANVTDTDLAGITYLGSFNITALAAGDLDGLTALTGLYLQNRSLTTLPAGVFDQLTALEYLRLSNGGMTTLPAGVFDQLTALEVLKLKNNGLTTLPAGVFDELTALTELWLEGNDLTTLPAGVFDELTALTVLALDGNGLTTLPAGVFDELTALTELALSNQENGMTTLPAGVFDNNPALTELFLSYNGMTTLPAGVFDELTALELLFLAYNDLTTLPAGVFEPLTALVLVDLTDNPGAPFAPTAVAVPDDGEVPVSGGTVTLDGSGSGAGPWGTNVTYGWRLTSGPTSRVTFDDAASAKPVVTIAALADGTEGTELTFTLTVTGRSVNRSLGTAPGTDTATVTVTLTDTAPVFTSPAGFSAAENQTAVGTVQATDGDAGDSVTGYTIAGGADAAKFSLGTGTGVLTFVAAPNYEDEADADGNNAYEVVVRATSGTGAREKTTDQPITVTVTDEDGEAPGPPAAPGVTAAGPTSLTVSWSEPSNSGPAVTGYDLQYRVYGTSGAFTAGDTNVSGTSTTIDELAEDTRYEVQVLARNAEGDSDWSASGSGATDANAAPVFTSPATFDAAENQTAVGTVEASDADAGDSVTGYTIEGGADRSRFSLDSGTGELTFVAAPNYEDEADADGNNAYEVVVRATSGTGAREKTADQPITVTVTDEDGEAPGPPAAPSVTAAGPTSLTVSWSEPSNSGPPVTGYDLQYRVGDSGAFTAGDTNVSGTSRTIDDLDENTTYEVQVLARNAEGDSDWSASGTGTTDANASPTFTSSATFSAAENQTAAGTVEATDGDAEDSVTGYTIAGGADQSRFSLDSATGELTFRSVPNHEAPTDAGGDNEYEVEVRATSGTGAREKTADQPITVTVTDEAEAPGPPDAPGVTAAGPTSLTVSWSEPSNSGPPVTGYDLQYRVGDSGAFTAGDTNVSGTSRTIDDLDENTTYEVQVLARNAEGDSDWSASGTGTTDANASPTGICGRTAAVRTAILLEIPGVSNCANVTDTDLAGITYLGSFNITALAAGDLDGLTALTGLYLQNRSLTTLPAGVFDQLTALEYLRLSNGGMTTLPAGVFDQLTALEELRLNNNGMTTLPAGVFDELTALTELALEGNDLTTLPAGVFDELTALTELGLDGNRLTTLPAGVFDELTALTELWLSNQENGMTTLPAGVFDNNPALTELFLSYNGMTTLPAGVFDELTALELLFLAYNDLTTLPAGVFEPLTALVLVDLTDNPGAPFAPTAVAVPDDGEVPVSGGTVTLDGSGSGAGPWGTNVTYQPVVKLCRAELSRTAGLRRISAWLWDAAARGSKRCGSLPRRCRGARGIRSTSV